MATKRPARIPLIYRLIALVLLGLFLVWMAFFL
jgi:hypothetical protein